MADAPPDPIPLHAHLDLEFLEAVADADHAAVRMPVAPNAFGFTANLHGGAVATLVDCACALAVVRSSGFDPEVESLVTVDMHVRYLGTPRTGAVVGRAKVVKAGSSIVVVECRVVDDEEHLVAVADFSMMRVPTRGA